MLAMSGAAESACKRARDYFDNVYNWQQYPPPNRRRFPPNPEGWGLPLGIAKDLIINIKWIFSDVELIRLILKDMQRSIDSGVAFADVHQIPQRVHDFYCRESLGTSGSAPVVWCAVGKPNAVLKRVWRK